VEDILFGGARGGGKSDALLGDWLSHAGIYGKNAFGLLFRQTHPQLEELQKRAIQIFPSLGAKWCAVSPLRSAWVFPNGATLRMRSLDNEQDAENFQGQSNTWIGFDEIGNWPEPGPIDRLRATLRGGPAGTARVMRATANPGGRGHQWLKERYVLPAVPMTPFYDKIKRVRRVFIPSKLQDNLILMENDPDYMDRIRSSGPEWLVRAWLDGDWDASAGDSFFTTDSLLVEGQPIPYPLKCDAVFAVMDTAVKTGKKRDGTGISFYALNKYYGTPLIILDWEAIQIQGALLEDFLPSVTARLEAFAQQCGAREGSLGIWIEDQQSGSVLLQQGQRMGAAVHPIEAKLTMKGKDERALLAAPYVYTNKVKISQYAFDKVTMYKENTKNHFWSQVTGYRLGVDNVEDDVFDTFAYAVIIGLGNAEGA
jgi:hypothetical protein